MSRRSLGVLATIIALGCTPSLDIERPPALDTFDRAVRERFEARYGSLEEALRSRANDAETARAYGELGHWFQVYGFPSLAERCYRQASTLEPENGQWPYLLGYLRLGDDRLAPALEAFEQARTRSPESNPVRLMLAETHRLDGQLDTAASLFRSALDHQPGLAFADAGLGRIALDQGDFAAAVEHLERALAAQPGASALHYPLARAYQGLGATDRATAALARVERENRHQVAVGFPDPWVEALNAVRDGVLHHLGLGKKARRAGRMAEAVAHLRRAVAADDENIDARLEMAITLGELGRYDAANRELEEADRLFPDNARVKFFAGTLLLKQRRLPEAEQALRASVALDARNATVHFNLAQVLRARDQLRAAIEHYDEALVLNPRMSRAAFWNAISRQRLGQTPTQVVAPLLVVQPTVPESTDAQPLLARLLTFDSRAAEAASLMEAIGADHDVFTAESYAMTLAGLGRYRVAAEWQQAAVAAIEAVERTPCSAAVARRRLTRYAAGRQADHPWAPDETFCELAVATP